MEMAEVIKLHVLLWSPRQGAYHIETVGEMLRNNGRMFDERHDREPSDYLPLQIAEDRETCQRSARQLLDHPEGNPA
jgi:hypothetical protein